MTPLICEGFSIMALTKGRCSYHMPPHSIFFSFSVVSNMYLGHIKGAPASPATGGEKKKKKTPEEQGLATSNLVY